MVKASFFCEIAMVTRGFETRLQILSSKEVHIVRRDGFNHVRDSIWRRHLPKFLGVRMAEWLRPGLWEVLMLSRGIEPGQVLTFKKLTGEGWY